ncbi:MAG TPA: hypothetical protein DDY52_03335 [Candidatus Moranbacteria bacterium]|nr:hypothetical protein [Candidatus Moranbacteria bacterium]
MEKEITLNDIFDEYKDSVPVPILEIADKLDIKVFETESLDDSESGLIRKEGNQYVIYVNANHSSTRKRFTIAHEIIHFLLHKSIINDDYVTQNRQPVMRKEEAEKEEERVMMEIIANKNAAKLLMPRDKFIYIWNKSKSIEEVANIFNVSPAAAAIRGSKLLDQIIM